MTSKTVLRWGVISAIVAVVAAGTVVVAVSQFSGAGVTGLVMLFCAIILVFVTFGIRAEYLPALALSLYVVIPSTIIPSSGFFRAFPPLTIVLIIWFLRRRLSWKREANDSQSPISSPTRSETTVRVLAVVFTIWTLFTLAISPYWQSGAGWVTSFVAAVILPLFAGNIAREGLHLMRAWSLLGGILGAYALLEFILQRNLLFGPLYSALGRESVQHWSVYRAEGSMGHPLFLGTFLAAATAISVALWLQSGSKKILIWAALSGAGVIATVSRGAMIATAVAVALVVVVLAVKQGNRSTARILGLCVIAALSLWAVVEFSSILERGDSAEATNSSAARDSAFNFAMSSMRELGWLGTGAGTSGDAAETAGFLLPIENSLLQLLVSIGIPGLILFVLMYGAAMVNAVKNLNYSAFAGAAALLVAFSGYNAIDTRRSMHLLIGCIIIMSFAKFTPAQRAKAVPRNSKAMISV